MRRGFLAFLILCAAARADEPHGARTFPLPSTRGPQLTVATVNVATTDLGDYFQLVVTDATGRRVWAGPRAADEADPLVFGAWHHGVSLPECVADVDGDGAVELIAPAPQSDVSPTIFRVLRWTGGSFVPVRTGSLMESPKGSGRYPWGRESRVPGRWVSRFLSADGPARVEITEYGEPDLRTGIAELEPKGDGFTLWRWVRPLAAPREEPEPIAEPTAEPIAEPTAEPIARYTCEIGREDLRSSTGKPLTTVADVLRQDRANVHRFKVRHPGDRDDETYFATTANRERFGTLPIDCPPDLAARIPGGGVTLDVHVYADRLAVAEVR